MNISEKTQLEELISTMEKIIGILSYFPRHIFTVDLFADLSFVPFLVNTLIH